MAAEDRRSSPTERGPVDFNRNYIERRDFPATRRGYDPDAVDRHLREVADTVEELQDLMGELQRAPRPEPQSLAGSAAEQVRLIIEAAEGSARGIEDSARRQAAAAEEQARQIIEAAEGTASDVDNRARQRAATMGQQVDEVLETRIAGVEETSDDLLRRADALEGELSSLGETHRLAGDLLAQLVAQASPLRGEMESMRGALEGLRGAGMAAEAETLEAMGTGEREGLEGAEAQAYAAVDDSEPGPWEDAGGLEHFEAEPVGGEDEAGSGHEDVEAAPPAAERPSPRPSDQAKSRPGSPQGRSRRRRTAVVAEEGTDESGEVDAPQPPARGAEEEIAPTATPDEGLPPEALESPEPDVPVDDEVEARGTRNTSAEGGGDEGARLVALNMALNGTPREETDRYLAENFALADRQAVLDDVYARAG